jgi:septum formation protein
MALLLASQSPRRRDILGRLGYAFEVRPSGFDEHSVSESLPPEEYVRKVAMGKALACAPTSSVEDIILASDLTVWTESGLADKPSSIEEARSIIPTVWNKWHLECGACVVGSAQQGWSVEISKTQLWVPELSPELFEEYLRIADPTDKAGGIDVKCFIKLAGRDSVKIEGDWSTVIGLNVFVATKLLTQYGYPLSVSAKEIEDKIAQGILSA